MDADQLQEFAASVLVNQDTIDLAHDDKQTLIDEIDRQNQEMPFEVFKAIWMSQIHATHVGEGKEKIQMAVEVRFHAMCTTVHGFRTHNGGCHTQNWMDVAFQNPLGDMSDSEEPDPDEPDPDEPDDEHM